LPQPPQLPGSLVRSAQNMPAPPIAGHIALGGGQLVEPLTHIAPVQDIPLAQA
jgi:hypothetical protein